MQIEAQRLAMPEASGGATTKNTDWPFLLSLGLITLASIAIRLYVGSKTVMDFDEWQHVFIASSPRLRDLRFELHVVAHPALFFWMLRGVFLLGRGILFYRLVSILAGAGSVFLVGLICHKICHNAVVALLAATGLALSTVAIKISTEVRSYELSVCFALLAFLFYLDLFALAGSKLRTSLGFALAMCLALEADYCAVFVLAACIGIWLLAVAINTEYRAGFSLPANRQRVLLLFTAFAVPCLLLIPMYSSVRHQAIQGYLYDFYWNFTPHETTLGFLLRNTLNEWNLFSPVSIHNSVTFIWVVAILAGCAIYLSLLNLRTKHADRSAWVPSPFVLLLLLEVIVLSFADKYPFGGKLRQQYILAPFLVIAVFALVDVLASKRSAALRTGIPLILVAAIFVNFAASAPKLIERPGWIVSKQEYDAYRAAFPNARAVYLTHFPVIAYFMNTDRLPRQFVRGIWDDYQIIDEYRMTAAGHPAIELFYAKDRERPDLNDQTLYQSLARCLQQSGVSELTLYFNIPGDGSKLPASPDVLTRTVIENAARAGLSTRKVVVAGSAVFAGFSLLNDSQAKN